MLHQHGPLRVGVGGPVGSGKTALMDALCKRLRDRYEIAAITNDIYTKWDAEYLVRSGALAPERIAGVETGGCPHTAIREDASINLAAVADMQQEISRARPDPDRIGRRQSGRDLLARAGRPDDLRHRRRGRRQDSVEGRSRHHPLRSPGHQQDRSRAPCRRLARRDGARRQAHARCAAVRVQQSAHRAGRRRHRALHRAEGRARRKVEAIASPCVARAAQHARSAPSPACGGGVGEGVNLHESRIACPLLAPLPDTSGGRDAPSTRPNQSDLPSTAARPIPAAGWRRRLRLIECWCQHGTVIDVADREALVHAAFDRNARVAADD